MDAFTSRVRRTIGIDGLISTIMGAFITVWPEKSASFVAGMIGFAFLAIGVSKLLVSLRDTDQGKSNRIIGIIMSILYMVAGLFIFLDIETATLSLLVVVGILTGLTWAIEGIVQMTIINRWGSNRVWTFISALISLLAGVTLVFSPLFGGLFLWEFFGIMLLVVGIVKLVHVAIVR
ncbi:MULTISPECIES: HdeD family acid-resistance protein [Fructobacillus]|uniref:HdeD family acid-resistance protein n=1 Tax=Fructobacillus TaxID=559173 RepID=UPI00064D7B15|nr:MULTISPECIES: DUF308 domain-containing protein [Fructobacillus]KMK52904.1 acid-resistance membrane protein [Fructobacillus sp. EFB-N1]MCK8628106.1 DUF308 domain-containing protein [Fructobacillus cardui]